jgi:RNA 2',3'-cyclic 3'-phosphodiesterase
MATVRTFVAVTLEPGVLRALEEAQGRLRALDGGRACRWIGAEGIHLTLHFLGDVPEERLQGVFDAAARGCCGFGPIDIGITSLGCFPNARQPRIVWAGVREETGRLADLQHAIGQELARVGYPPERRPFTPHLTIGRVRRDAARGEIVALGRSVSAQPQEVLAEMRVARVHVIKSDLRPSGAVYTVMAISELRAEASRGD